MAALFSTLLCRNSARVLLLSLVFFAGCFRRESSELATLKTELESTQGKLSEAQKALTTTNDQLTLATTTLDAAKSNLAEKEKALSERDAQLRKLQTEFDTLKKNEAIVFADIRSLQQQGRNIIALSRYQQFLKDYPSSPLAIYATAAVAEITAESQRDAQRLANLTDPKRQEREILGLFRDGLLTPRELAPLIKRKTRAQVIGLLGKPSHVFPDGTEIGYSDKITNPATGRRGMLIITFDAAGVSALRVDYAGQKLIP